MPNCAILGLVENVAVSNSVSGALALIGNTPLVPLRRLPEPGWARTLVKLENRNPSGSVKDRIALAVVEDYEARGLLRPGSQLVWATGGNSGAALALVCGVKGCRLTVFMPSNAPLNQRRLMERYGAQVQLTAPNGGMAGAMDGARRFAAENAGCVLLDLFQEPAVVEAHYRGTGGEIVRDTGGQVDAFVAAVGTGGTITGVGRRLKEVNPQVRVIAVEPAGSPVLSQGRAGRHMIPGIGADFVPPLLDRAVVDSVLQVTDEQASDTAGRLAREEGLLAGLSSGANVYAALQVAEGLGSGAVVVTVLPDTGERYIDFPI